LLFGQQPASQPVFSVGTTLVQVDAEVTDSKQRHVTNLRAEDFEVILDHKVPPITNLTYVDLDGADANGLASTPDSGRSIAASFVTRPEYVRRSMVIVVDDLGLSFPSVECVRRALRQFIKNQMQPGDLVAIWETGRSNSVFQQLTSDKHTLEAGVGFAAILTGLGGPSG
jgi:VWFA-related protein